MRNTLIKILVISSVLVTMISCNKKDAILGAEIIAPSSSFEIVKELSLNATAVDFTTSDIKAEVEFNEKVNFTVTITGMKSAAKRTLKFQADKLEIDETLWNGNHEGVQYFYPNEDVKLELSFFGGKVSPMIKTIHIDKARDFFVSNPGRIAGSKYYNVEKVPEGLWGPSLWQHFSSYGADLSDTVKADVLKPVEGRKSYMFASSDVNKIGFRGGADFTFDYNGITGKFKYIDLLGSSPDDVYLNFFLYGTGDPTVTVVVVVLEDDDLSGKHDRTKEDRYLITVPLDFVGWKHYSIKYSELPRAINVEYGGNGNKVRETDRIQIISIGYNSSEKGDKKAYFDNVFFTIGGPFDPTKF